MPLRPQGKLNEKSVTERARKSPNTPNLNNTLSNNKPKKKSQEKQKNTLNSFVFISENKTSKFVGCSKRMPRGKFKAVNACIGKEGLKPNNLSFHLRTLEEEGQTKFKVSRRKEKKLEQKSVKFENRKSRKK